MSNKSAIKVTINSKEFPINVKEQDREKVVVAAERLNNTINKYKKLYNPAQSTDYIIMAALQLTTEYIELEKNIIKGESLNKLNDIVLDLENFLEINS